MEIENAGALMVIDMQNSFLHEEGGMRHPPRGGTLLAVAETIEHTARAVERAVAVQVPVIYTRHCYRSDYADASPSTLALFEQMGKRPLQHGTWDAEVVDELKPVADGLIVDKARFDAFYNTDLELLLRGLGARRLVLTGVVTNVCVESTARAAFMRDLEVTILADCCTTYTEQHQTHALDALKTYGIASVATVSGAAV